MTAAGRWARSGSRPSAASGSSPLPILGVGLIGEREDGLAAAVLALALVTVHFAALAAGKLLYPEEESR